MIIVCGHLMVDNRTEYLEECVELVTMARAAHGCLDFALSADLIDPTRINILERWTDTKTLGAFRGSGTGEDQDSHILSARVDEYYVDAG